MPKDFFVKVSSNIPRKKYPYGNALDSKTGNSRKLIFLNEKAFKKQKIDQFFFRNFEKVFDEDLRKVVQRPKR